MMLATMFSRSTPPEMMRSIARRTAMMITKAVSSQRMPLLSVTWNLPSRESLPAII